MEKNDKSYWRNFISLIGAGIIGFGLGVYFADTFAGYALWIVIVGILLHGWAMYKSNKE